MKNKKPIFLYLLLALILLLAIGAFYGGITLIISPDGSMLGTPLEILQDTIFPNFLIPGIILFLVNGVFPLLVFFALIFKWNWKWAEALNLYKNQHWSLTFSYYIGFILSLWIVFQVAILKDISFFHFIYIIWGMVIVFISQLPSLRKYYKKNE
ncbi:hypothetical protein KKC88_02375 [Patescibacteria group bacterium]|nr:hypothetical protein [Patescibacteria group bacterium]MBU1672954.1 hypothetical protein [Patescibacteria group bacterium]